MQRTRALVDDTLPRTQDQLQMKQVKRDFVTESIIFQIK